MTGGRLLDAKDCWSCGEEEASLLLSVVLVEAAAATTAGGCVFAVASSGVTNAAGTFGWKPATDPAVKRQERPARAAHSKLGVRLIIFMVQ